jgi:hypothetical protein
MPPKFRVEGVGSEIANVNVLLAVNPFASFTATVRDTVPAAVGVPESAPPADIVSVEGCPLAVNVYGAVPPVAANVAEYAVPTVPSGADVVVIVSDDGAILIAYVCVA